MNAVINSRKIAVITGASKGIGKAVALALAEEAYHVFLLARNQKNLEAAKESILENGGLATAYPVDVSQPNTVKEVIQKIVEQVGRIDVLFNNAGILRMGSIDVPDEEMARQVEVNLLGAMYVAKYVALQMKKQQSGYIMNLASMSGQRGHPRMGCYSATKFGLVGFSESLYKELISKGVKVTSICPSFVATDMVASFDFPLEKMIRAEDIVKTVRYLLSVSKNAAIANINLECTDFVTMKNAT